MKYVIISCRIRENWRKLMNKKLLSVIVSGALLAGLCPAAKAQEVTKFGKVKNTVVDLIKNHKKIAIGSAAGAVLATGGLTYYLLRDKNSNMPTSIEGKLVESERKLINNFVKNIDKLGLNFSVENISADGAQKVHQEAVEVINNQQNSKSSKEKLIISEKIEGIEEWSKDAKGTLVLTKSKLDNGSTEVKFKFKGKNITDSNIFKEKLEPYEKNLSASANNLKRAITLTIASIMFGEDADKSMDIVYSELNEFKTAIIARQNFLSQEKGLGDKTNLYNDNVSKKMPDIKNHIKCLVSSVSCGLKKQALGEKNEAKELLDKMDIIVKKLLTESEAKKSGVASVYITMIMRVAYAQIMGAIE